MTTYSNSVTLGNILTIGAMIVSVALAYGRLTAADEMQVARTEALAKTIAETSAESRGFIQNADARLRSLENVQTRVDAQFEAMRDSLGEIKDQTRAIEALVRQMIQNEARKP